MVRPKMCPRASCGLDHGGPTLTRGPLGVGHWSEPWEKALSPLCLLPAMGHTAFLCRTCPLCSFCLGVSQLWTESIKNLRPSKALSLEIVDVRYFIPGTGSDLQSLFMQGRYVSILPGAPRCELGHLRGFSPRCCIFYFWKGLLNDPLLSTEP